MESITTEDLVSSKRVVVCVAASDKVSDALKTLVEHKILCVPVLDSTVTPPKVVGLFDMIDVLQVVLTVACDFKDTHAAELTETLLEAWGDKSKPPPNVEELLSGQSVFHTLTVAEAMNASEQNATISVAIGTSLLTIVQTMLVNHVRRVVVTDADGQLHNIITQSQIIQFLSENIGHFQALAGRTMQELDAYNVWRPVVTVRPEQPAVDAFQLMRKHKISGVAVVNEEGKLIDSIGVRDLRILDGKFDCGSCVQPLTVFLQRVRDASSASIATTRPHAPITFQLSDKLGDVIQRVATARVHRIFAVDSSNKLLAIASLSDLLKVFVS